MFVCQILVKSVSKGFKVPKSLKIIQQLYILVSNLSSSQTKKTSSRAVHVVSLQKRAAWSELGCCRVLLQHLFKLIQSENSFVNVTAVVGFCQSCTTISFVELGSGNVSLTVMKRISLWTVEKPLKGSCAGYFWLCEYHGRLLICRVCILAVCYPIKSMSVYQTSPCSCAEARLGLCLFMSVCLNIILIMYVHSESYCFRNATKSSVSTLTIRNMG